MRFVAGLILVVVAPFLSPPVPTGSWVELGPRSSGRVSAIAVQDLQHLWAASPGGAVWKSADGGADLHNVPITQVIVAPLSPGRVLASTYGRGSWQYDWGSSAPCGR
jgi:hypothetical protein